jgi:Bacterial regulatory protein, Fis family
MGRRRTGHLGGRAAAELLSKSENRETKDCLLAVSRCVLFLVVSLPSPPTWKGFNFIEAVRRYEARLIQRALRDAGGVVTRAAQLLGIERRSLDAMLRKGRHRALANLRTPVEPRRRSLMFRDEVEIRPVVPMLTPFCGGRKTCLSLPRPSRDYSPAGRSKCEGE